MHVKGGKFSFWVFDKSLAYFQKDFLTSELWSTVSIQGLSFVIPWSTSELRNLETYLTSLNVFHAWQPMSRFLISLAPFSTDSCRGLCLFLWFQDLKFKSPWWWREESIKWQQETRFYLLLSYSNHEMMIVALFELKSTWDAVTHSRWRLAESLSYTQPLQKWDQGNSLSLPVVAIWTMHVWSISQSGYSDSGCYLFQYRDINNVWCSVF